MVQIHNVDSLTAELFNKLFEEKWKLQRNNERESESLSNVVVTIESVSLQRVEQGVLSEVYRVHLEYKDHIPQQSSLSLPPTDWLVKLCRSDLNLSWMCRNETNFYSRIAPKLNIFGSHFLLETQHDKKDDTGDFPFEIPNFLSGDDQHVVIQEVLDIDTFPLTDGCPTDKIPFLLRALAAMHAKCWNSPHSMVMEECLVFPTGMGQRLHPLQKEGLFVTSWKDTLQHMQLDPEKDAELLAFATETCHQLATRKLRIIHDKVHQNRTTLIHGDFHIANWLFPKTDNKDRNQKHKPSLVDWATAGYGNPMVDLVFFLVVSTNDKTVANLQSVLEQYYTLLLECNPDLKSTLSLDTLQDWFPWAIILQWMILVAYDSICRNIAMSEDDLNRRESQMQHFRNVNKRAILALFSFSRTSPSIWNSVLSSIETATDSEKEEAQDFCRNTPLSI